MLTDTDRDPHLNHRRRGSGSSRYPGDRLHGRILPTMTSRFDDHDLNIGSHHLDRDSGAARGRGATVRGALGGRGGIRGGGRRGRGFESLPFNNGYDDN